MGYSIGHISEKVKSLCKNEIILCRDTLSLEHKSQDLVGSFGKHLMRTLCKGCHERLLYSSICLLLFFSILHNNNHRRPLGKYLARLTFP